MTPNETFQLELQGHSEVCITRNFEATREAVWDALTNPTELPKWLGGPVGWSMTLCVNELFDGGEYRWVWTSPNGDTMTMAGVNTQCITGHLVARTESIDFGAGPAPGEQSSTLTLSPLGHHTRLQLVVNYGIEAAREAVLASGMAHGMAAAYRKLDELLAKRA